MVRGICAGDARKISAASFVLGPLFEHEQTSGGIFRGVLKSFLTKKKATKESLSCELVTKARSEHWNVWSLQGGLDTLVQALEDRLSSLGVKVVKETAVREVSSSEECEDRRIRVTMTAADGKTVDDCFDQVFLTCPASVSARALRSSCPSAAAFLSDIPFVTVAVVSLEFDHRISIPDAFGFLVPTCEPNPLLGVIFDSCSFPRGENKSLLTAMLGGHRFDDLFSSCTEEEIERVAVDAVSEVLGIDRAPSRVVTRVQKECMPQYTVGHAARVHGAREALERDRGIQGAVRLAGFCYDGVGINDAIMSAKRQVIEVLSK